MSYNCNCYYPEYYSNYSNYPEYSEEYKIKIKKPKIGKIVKDVGKGLEKVGDAIKSAIPNPAELAKYGKEILGKMEEVMRTLGFNDIADIIDEIQKLIPKDGVIALPKNLANKLLQFILGKVISMLPGGAAIKPIFSKFIWPLIKKDAINLLRDLIKKIRLPGIKYSLTIETFIYESYNCYGQLEYHSDIYEGYNSPFSEYENYEIENYYYDSYSYGSYENYAEDNQVCISQENFDKMLELALKNCQ